MKVEYVKIYYTCNTPRRDLNGAPRYQLENRSQKSAHEWEIIFKMILKRWDMIFKNEFVGSVQSSWQESCEHRKRTVYLFWLTEYLPSWYTKLIIITREVQSNLRTCKKWSFVDENSCTSALKVLQIFWYQTFINFIVKCTMKILICNVLQYEGLHSVYIWLLRNIVAQIWILIMHRSCDLYLDAIMILSSNKYFAIAWNKSQNTRASVLPSVHDSWNTCT